MEFLRSAARLFSSARREPQSKGAENCVVFMDQAQRFQYSTFSTEQDRTGIIKGLESSGATVVRVTSVAEGIRLSKIQTPDESTPHRFR